MRAIIRGALLLREKKGTLQEKGHHFQSDLRCQLLPLRRLVLESLNIHMGEEKKEKMDFKKELEWSEKKNLNYRKQGLLKQVKANFCFVFILCPHSIVLNSKNSGYSWIFAKESLLIGSGYNMRCWGCNLGQMHASKASISYVLNSLSLSPSKVKHFHYYPNR